ncbi:MAG: DUF2993 domain-containing protein [Elainellaceae cyanobacterium]
MSLERVGLLELLISQLIKASISDQLTDVDHLNVDVSAALDQLLQGEATDISVHSKGLWLTPELKINALDVEISRFSISLIEALKGRLSLDEPLVMSVDVSLDELGLNKFLNTPLVCNWLQNVVFLDGAQAFSLVLEQMACTLNDNQLGVELEAKMQRHGAVQQASPSTIVVTGRLQVSPQGTSHGQGHRPTLIYLEEARFKPNQAPLLAETAAILGWAGALIGQRHIEENSFSATIRALLVTDNRLDICLDIQVEQLTPLLTYLERQQLDELSIPQQA